MADAQRRFEQSLDERILAASPAELDAMQAIDRRAQLSGLSFYDVYLDSAGGACPDAAIGGTAGGAGEAAAARPAAPSARRAGRRGRHSPSGRGGRKKGGGAASRAGTAAS